MIIAGYVQCDQEPTGFAATQFAGVLLIFNAYHPVA
jgi:hypothetical protein